MSELKENVEKLNNLYFELNGMYSGAVEALKHAGKQSDEVCFLEETLDLKYLSPYLEELDDYVIEKIFHGLDINAYLYTIVYQDFSNMDLKALFEKSAEFNVGFLKELTEIEQSLYKIDAGIPNLNILCGEMRDMADQINESLFHISRDTVDFVMSDVQNQEEFVPESL